LQIDEIIQKSYIFYQLIADKTTVFLFFQKSINLENDEEMSGCWSKLE